MNAIKKFFVDLFNDFKDWVFGIWTDLVEMLTDLPLLVFEAFTDGLTALISSIPVPTFLNTSLSSYLNGGATDILYFLSQSGLTTGFGLIATGFAFRLTRKIFTLGQW